MFRGLMKTLSSVFGTVQTARKVDDEHSCDDRGSNVDRWPLETEPATERAVGTYSDGDIYYEPLLGDGSTPENGSVRTREDKLIYTGSEAVDLLGHNDSSIWETIDSPLVSPLDITSPCQRGRETELTDKSNMSGWEDLTEESNIHSHVPPKEEDSVVSLPCLVETGNGILGNSLIESAGTENDLASSDMHVHPSRYDSVNDSMVVIDVSFSQPPTERKLSPCGALQESLVVIDSIDEINGMKVCGDNVVSTKLPSGAIEDSEVMNTSDLGCGDYKRAEEIIEVTCKETFPGVKEICNEAKERTDAKEESSFVDALESLDIAEFVDVMTVQETDATDSVPDEAGKSPNSAASRKTKRTGISPQRKRQRKDLSPVKGQTDKNLSEQTECSPKKKMENEKEGYIDFVLRKSEAGELIFPPKKLIYQLGYVTNISCGDLESAIISQYKIAAGDKKFGWIRDCRYHAEILFSPKWIDENLPSMEKGRRNQEWKKRKQRASARAESQMYSGSGNVMCQDIRLKSDPTLNVVRENAVEVSNKENLEKDGVVRSDEKGNIPKDGEKSSNVKDNIPKDSEKSSNVKDNIPKDSEKSSNVKDNIPKDSEKSSNVKDRETKGDGKGNILKDDEKKSKEMGNILKDGETGSHEKGSKQKDSKKRSDRKGNSLKDGETKSNEITIQKDGEKRRDESENILKDRTKVINEKRNMQNDSETCRGSDDLVAGTTPTVQDERSTHEGATSEGQKRLYGDRTCTENKDITSTEEDRRNTPCIINDKATNQTSMTVTEPPVLNKPAEEKNLVCNVKSNIIATSGDSETLKQEMVADSGTTVDDIVRSMRDSSIAGDNTLQETSKDRLQEDLVTEKKLQKEIDGDSSVTEMDKFKCDDEREATTDTVNNEMNVEQTEEGGIDINDIRRYTDSVLSKSLEKFADTMSGENAQSPLPKKVSNSQNEGLTENKSPRGTISNIEHAERKVSYRDALLHSSDVSESTTISIELKPKVCTEDENSTELQTDTKIADTRCRLQSVDTLIPSLQQVVLDEEVCEQVIDNLMDPFGDLEGDMEKSKQNVRQKDQTGVVKDVQEKSVDFTSVKGDCIANKIQDSDDNNQIVQNHQKTIVQKGAKKETKQQTDFASQSKDIVAQVITYACTEAQDYSGCNTEHQKSQETLQSKSKKATETETKGNHHTAQASAIIDEQSVKCDKKCTDIVTDKDLDTSTQASAIIDEQSVKCDKKCTDIVTDKDLDTSTQASAIIDEQSVKCDKKCTDIVTNKDLDTSTQASAIIDEQSVKCDKKCTDIVTDKDLDSSPQASAIIDEQSVKCDKKCTEIVTDKDLDDQAQANSRIQASATEGQTSGDRIIEKRDLKTRRDIDNKQSTAIDDQNSTKQDKKSTKLDKDITKPYKDSTKPDKKSTKLDKGITKPDKDSTKPDKKSTKLDKGITKPDKDSTKPDKKSTKLDKDITKPDKDSTKPDKKSTKLGKDITKPDKDSTKPDKKSTKLDTDITKPDKDSPKSDKDSTKQDKGSTKPVKKSTKSNKDFTKPDIDSTMLDTDSTQSDKSSTKLDKGSTKPNKKNTKPNKDNTKTDKESTKPDKESTKPNKDHSKPDKDSTKPDKNSPNIDMNNRNLDQDNIWHDEGVTKLDKDSTVCDSSAVQRQEQNTRTDNVQQEETFESIRKSVNEFNLKQELSDLLDETFKKKGIKSHISQGKDKHGLSYNVKDATKSDTQVQTSVTEGKITGLDGTESVCGATTEEATKEGTCSPVSGDSRDKYDALYDTVKLSPPLDDNAIVASNGDCMMTSVHQGTLGADEPHTSHQCTTVSDVLCQMKSSIMNIDTVESTQTSGNMEASGDYLSMLQQILPNVTLPTETKCSGVEGLDVMFTQHTELEQKCSTSTVKTSQVFGTVESTSGKAADQNLVCTQQSGPEQECSVSKVKVCQMSEVMTGQESSAEKSRTAPNSTSKIPKMSNTGKGNKNGAKTMDKLSAVVGNEMKDLDGVSGSSTLSAYQSECKEKSHAGKWKGSARKQYSSIPKGAGHSAKTYSKQSPEHKGNMLKGANKGEKKAKSDAGTHSTTTHKDVNIIEGAEGELKGASIGVTSGQMSLSSSSGQSTQLPGSLLVQPLVISSSSKDVSSSNTLKELDALSSNKPAATAKRLEPDIVMLSPSDEHTSRSTEQDGLKPSDKSSNKSTKSDKMSEQDLDESHKKCTKSDTKSSLTLNKPSIKSTESDREMNQSSGKSGTKLPKPDTEMKRSSDKCSSIKCTEPDTKTKLSLEIPSTKSIRQVTEQTLCAEGTEQVKQHTGETEVRGTVSAGDGNKMTSEAVSAEASTVSSGQGDDKMPENQAAQATGKVRQKSGQTKKSAKVNKKKQMKGNKKW